MLLILLMPLVSLSEDVMGRRDILSFIPMITMVNVLFINRREQACLTEDVMDRSVSLGEDMRISQMLLKSFYIMRFAAVVLTHVLLESSLCFPINLIVVGLLCSNETFHDLGITLQDIEAKLEDVVHFERVSEALLLEVSIDVAQSLGARRVLNSHFYTLLVFFFKLL